MSTLVSIRLQNYRCFADHTIDFGRTTIVVGRNNAGKSTLIEALRLVSVALTRFRGVVAVQAPSWLDDARTGPGQRLDLQRLGVVHETLFHYYGDGPARIDALFDDGSQLIIHIGPEGQGHAIFVMANGNVVRRRNDIRGELPRIAILPQIQPLEREEKILNREYVTERLNSHLASRHFRNQLVIFRDQYFREFVELVEESWHSVRINSLETSRRDTAEVLQLMVRDGGFVAEAGWMGHGLQMWLQIIWFVTRTSGSGALVLDEPDVYMHPDLQRKLVRMLVRRGTQLVVATHSTEIMAEVDATSVLVLDREQSRSTFATGLPAVQKIIEGMGSAQNLQIARLWRTKVLVLVEGEDMQFLKRIHDLVVPNSPMGIDMYPNWSIGGWTGWPTAMGSATALQNSVHESITCYCIFDSDYHLSDEKNRRYEQADVVGVQLHILKKKEIENYLLVPSLVHRVIVNSLSGTAARPSVADIETKIDDFARTLLDDVRDSFATEYSLANRGVAAGTASAWAREHVASLTNSREGRTSIVPGKKMISMLSGWSKESFNVSFSIQGLLRAMRASEVDEEMRRLVVAISNGTSLPAAIR